MSNAKSQDSQNRQSSTGSNEQANKPAAGKEDKRSNEHMSRQKAGKDEGAGGGAKQKQKH